MKKLIATCILLVILMAISGCKDSDIKDNGQSPKGNDSTPLSGQTLIDEVATRIKNVFEY